MKQSRLGYVENGLSLGQFNAGETASNLHSTCLGESRIQHVLATQRIGLVYAARDA